MPIHLRTEELIQAVYDVIDRVRTEGVSEEDLQKVKELQRQSRKKDLEENRYWQGQMVGSWMDDTDIYELTLESLEKHLSELSTEDIEKTVEKYFKDSRKMEAVLMPESHREQ